MSYKTNRRTRGVFSTNNPPVGALGHERFACEDCGRGLVQGTEYEMDGKILCQKCWNERRVVQLTEGRELTTKAEYSRLADEYAETHGGRAADGSYWTALTRPTLETTGGVEHPYSDTMWNFPTELEARRYGDLLTRALSNRKHQIEYKIELYSPLRQ